ncbi:MAG: hypothetical protein ACKOBA_05835 [Limnohabitans sp.]
MARYRCAACGVEAREHVWHCPGCQTWDSYPPKRIEEVSFSIYQITKFNI